MTRIITIGSLATSTTQESETQHTQFRQLASRQGRWLSPDPYLGSIDLGNPQSINRYSYVLNNPLSLRDPTGLDCVYLNDSGDGIEEVDADMDTSSAECGSTGGYYLPGVLTGFGRGDDGTITNFSFTPF